MVVFLRWEEKRIPHRWKEQAPREVCVSQLSDYFLHCCLTIYVPRRLHIPIFISFSHSYAMVQNFFLWMLASYKYPNNKFCCKHFGYIMWYCADIRIKIQNGYPKIRSAHSKTNYLEILSSFLPQLPYDLIWRWQKFIKEYRISKIM